MNSQMSTKLYLISLLMFISACSSGHNYANRVISVSDLDERPSQIVKNYTIGIGDVLRINVWKNADLDAEVPVRPDGKISAPLVGDVTVAGLTPEYVANVLRGKLKKYIRAPNVVVIVSSLGSTTFLSRVRVTGAVENNVSLQHSQGMTVLDAVLEAGGPNEFANAESASIFRRLDDETVLIPINLNSILNEGNLNDNIILKPGDTITIPERLF